MSTITTTTIGGHFGTYESPSGNGQFFGGIVALTSAADLPDSIDLATPDVLATTRLTFPYPSADVSAPLTVTLNPGHYALVFGSGLFGATGYGGAKLNNGTLGDPSWITTPNSDIQLPWADANIDDGMRFFITAVPEPNAAALVAIATFAILALRRRPISRHAKTNR
jgi:hypothetical protein